MKIVIRQNLKSKTIEVYIINQLPVKVWAFRIILKLSLYSDFNKKLDTYYSGSKGAKTVWVRHSKHKEFSEI